MASEQIEAPRPQRIPYWRLMLDQGVVTPEIIEYPYAGEGTEEEPYIIEWIPDDPRNPMLFSSTTKWTYTVVVAFATFAVSLCSSAYTGTIQEIVKSFGIVEEVATLGVALFVLGFAVGPLIWAPLSELVGRQVVYLFTFFALAAFSAGGAGAQNSWSLVILRFFAGSFGASPLTNAGGVIADIFTADKRGLAMCLFAGAPFLGPTMGPVVGGFLGQGAGWRWVQGFMAIFSGLIWIVGILCIPETYAPLLLRKRAERLSKITGHVYRSKLDLERGAISVKDAFGAALLRPWILLFVEPIVLLLSVYMAIIYGTLYMLFGAFPIVYQEIRGWNEGVGSLPFLGVMVGMMIAVGCNMWDNKRYVRVNKKHNGFAPPETRLLPTMVGGIAIPIGLFWFAWTDGPNVHWIVSIIAGAPFGFGMVLVFLSIMTYLVDAYTIYAASVLAANSVIRSCFGAGFPLFTTYMYHKLGIHWATCIPAFLSVACVPFPFLFYQFGPQIRLRCKYAAEADDFKHKLMESVTEQPETKDADLCNEAVEGAEGDNRESIQDASTSEDEAAIYQENPYDIDRVNTRNSQITQRSAPRSSTSRRKKFGIF